MPIANVKTYSIGVRYKSGANIVRTTARIVKNIRVAPTRSIRAADARQTAHAAAKAAGHNRTSTNSLIISGGGTDQVNGEYIADGTLNGQISYTNTNGLGATINFNGSTWNIGSGGFTVYAGGATLTSPFTVSGGAIGQLPAPTLAFATVGSKPYVKFVEVTTPMLASQLRLLSVKRGLYKFATGMG